MVHALLIKALYEKIRNWRNPPEPPLPTSEEEREILAYRVLKRAVYHDLSYRVGERLTPEELDKILFKAAKKMRVSHGHELLKPYIFNLAEKTYCWEYDSKNKCYIIR
jgi:hypothetical protein